MNFLNVGPWELTVILIIAVLLVGPKRMVEIARTIGRVTSHMRQLSSEFLGAIQSEIQATEQETRQALDGIAEEGRGSIASFPEEMQAARQETRQILAGAGREEREAVLGIRDEVEAIQRETAEVMGEIAANVEGVIRGEKGTKDEASNQQRR